MCMSALSVNTLRGNLNVPNALASMSQTERLASVTSANILLFPWPEVYALRKLTHSFSISFFFANVTSKMKEGSSGFGLGAPSLSDTAETTINQFKRGVSCPNRTHV